MTDLQGRKKKPEEPPRPYEADDTLRSIQIARIIDLISEGPIEGLIDGDKSIFFDDVPLRNEDGSLNFNGASYSMRPGTAHQSVLPNFSYAERQIDVGVEFKQDDEPTRIVYDENVDSVVFRISINGLSYRDDAGNVVGTEVSFGFYVTGSDGDKVELGKITINGKASSRYDRDFAYKLPAGKHPWKISVKRFTPDETALSDRRYNNQTFWSAYTERIEDKLNYPYSALCGLTIDSRHFSSIPNRRYNIRGRKVMVPSNRRPDLEFGRTWDPLVSQYDGYWDGTFKPEEEWTRNPAWCMYDMLTMTRYGLGQWFNPPPLPGEPPSPFLGSPYIDKWTFYEIGKYCDELVPDGKGGLEPRFAMNTYLQNATDAYSLMAQMASVFRGMLLWAGNGAMLSCDRPQDPVYLFTNSNVADGMFTYSGSNRRSRLTAVYVSWNDPQDGYRRQVEYVEDQAGIARYGVNTVEINAFGCTSQGQARRAGLWAIFSSIYETETISFVTGTQAAALLPGQLVNIMDEHRNGLRWGGFIRARGSEIVGSVSKPYIDLDSEVKLRPGVTYQLFFTAEPVAFQMTDGYGQDYTLDATAPGGAQQVVRNGDSTVRQTTVTVSQAGDYTRLYLGALPNGEMPSVGGMWNLSEPSTVEPVYARVVAIDESGEGQFRVLCVQHFPGKFDAIENGLTIPAEPRRNTIRPIVPRGVTDVSHVESLYLENLTVKSSLSVSWVSPSDASAFRVRYRYDGLTVQADGTHVPSGRGTWAEFGVLNEPTLTLMDTREGFYTIEITSVNAFGMISPNPVEYQLEVFGKAAPPSTVNSDSIRATLEPGGIAIRWTDIADLDLDYYIVRATPLDAGEYFGREEVVAETLSTSALYATARGKGTTFLITIQSVDTSGIASVHVASKTVVFDPPAIVQDFTVVQNLAYLDFYWKPVAGAVSYQIRAGQQWESAELLGETSAPQLSIEWGRTGEKVFWIRAYDALGNPSPLPTGETTDVAKPPARNVVLEELEGPLFTGFMYNLENTGVELQILGTETYGEYYHSHAIGTAHDVIVTIDTDLTATFESGITWADMDFTWVDQRANQTWVKAGEVSQIELQHYVAVDEAADPDIKQLWKLDSASAFTPSIAAPGTSVAYSGTVSYADGLFGDGLVAASGLVADFVTAGLGAEFTAYWTYRVAASDIGRRLMRIEGAGAFWELSYDSQRLLFLLRCSDGVGIELSRKAAFAGTVEDLVSVMQQLGFPYQHFGVFASTNQADVDAWLAQVTQAATIDRNGDGLLGPIWQEYTTIDFWGDCLTFLNLLAAASPYLAAKVGPEYLALEAYCARVLVSAGLTFSLEEGDMVFFAVSQFSESKVILGQTVTRQKRSVFVRKHGDDSYLYGEIDAVPMTLNTLRIR